MYIGLYNTLDICKKNLKLRTCKSEMLNEQMKNFYRYIFIPPTAQS